MTDSISKIQQLEKIKALTRQAAGMHPLPKEIISKSLHAALRSQGHREDISKISQNIPNSQLQKTIKIAMGPTNAIETAMGSYKATQEAIKAAMGPTNAIETVMDSYKATQAAINAMPSSTIQKAVEQIQTVSLPKVNSLPRTPMQLTSRARHSNFHALRNVAELGSAIRHARKSKRLTQQSFADLAGVGRRFVSELEQGKQTLEIGKVLKVAAAAGIQLMFIPADTNP